MKEEAGGRVVRGVTAEGVEVPARLDVPQTQGAVVRGRDGGRAHQLRALDQSHTRNLC